MLHKQCALINDSIRMVQESKLGHTLASAGRVSGMVINIIL